MSEFGVDESDLDFGAHTAVIEHTNGVDLVPEEVISGVVMNVSPLEVKIAYGAVSPVALEDGEETISAGGDFFGIPFADLSRLSVGDSIEVRHG